MECAVGGLESRKLSFGLGGSGGGVPSLDTDDSDTPLADVLLDALLITLMVGLAKSCCWTLSSFLGAGELARLLVVVPEAGVGANGSADPGSAMAGGCVFLHGQSCVGGSMERQTERVVGCDMVVVPWWETGSHDW